jgi:hypothetical protein
MTLEEILRVFYDTENGAEERLAAASQAIAMLRTTIAVAERMDGKQGQPCDHGLLFDRRKSQGESKCRCKMCGEVLFTWTAQ